jgi:uncharacterized protein (DUF433 family)
MIIPTELENILVSTPDTLSGAVRFKGTRVPVQALIDTLDEGGTLRDFMDGWPGVPSDAAVAVIHWQQEQSRRAFGLGLVV